MAKERSGPIAPLHLSASELDRLLDGLDSKSRDPAEQLRKHERIPCRKLAMVITVDQQGYETTFIIPVRNISEGGVGFLHRSMLHCETRCQIRIRRPDGEWLKTWGKVVRSRYISDSICEIGVAFDKPVDISPFRVS